MGMRDRVINLENVRNIFHYFCIFDFKISILKDIIPDNYRYMLEQVIVYNNCVHNISHNIKRVCLHSGLVT